MSTTRPYSAGDHGQEPEGAATAGTPTGREPTDSHAGQNGRAEQNGRREQSARIGRSGRAGRTGHPPDQKRTIRLTDADGVVPCAREFTRQALYDWGWLPAATGEQRAAAEDVLLVVSELVTNACLHAGGAQELRIVTGPKSLRLEVVDPGGGAPVPRTPHRPGRPGGHGMFIVQRLCLDWGVVRDREGTGKTVWAELAAPC